METISMPTPTPSPTPKPVTEAIPAPAVETLPTLDRGRRARILDALAPVAESIPDLTVAELVMALQTRAAAVYVRRPERGQPGALRVGEIVEYNANRHEATSLGRSYAVAGTETL